MKQQNKKRNMETIHLRAELANRTNRHVWYEQRERVNYIAAHPIYKRSKNRSIKIDILALGSKWKKYTMFSFKTRAKYPQARWPTPQGH